MRPVLLALLLALVPGVAHADPTPAEVAREMAKCAPVAAVDATSGDGFVVLAFRFEPWVPGPDYPEDLVQEAVLVPYIPQTDGRSESYPHGRYPLAISFLAEGLPRSEYEQEMAFAHHFERGWIVGCFRSVVID